jgi:uncharacterized protein YecE (DUF72 family)
LIRIGISGWRYPPWRGVFYPQGLAQRRELEFCAQHFSTVEINGSFYSLQRPEYYEAWYRGTPRDFVFSVKGSRYITHMLRLKNIEKPLANFYASGILNLKDKLGPFLWQFPETFHYRPQRLERFFSMLPRNTQQALALARRREPAAAARDRDPPPELREPGVSQAPAQASHRPRRGRHGRQMAKAVRRHGGLRLRAPARRQGDLRERLLQPRAGRVGAAHPRMAQARRRVRLLRQRREGEGALRRADPHAQAGPDPARLCRAPRRLPATISNS